MATESIIRRLGRVRVPSQILAHINGELALRHLLSGCIVIRCEHRHDFGGFDYILACEDFDDLGQGLLAPEYPVDEIWQRVPEDDPDIERLGRVRLVMLRFGKQGEQPQRTQLSPAEEAA